MSAVNVLPERGRMEPSFDNKTIGSTTLTDLCAQLIELQDEDDDPEDTFHIQKLLDKEWTVCVNKVLKQLLNKLQCRKCGVKPLQLTEVLAHSQTFNPKLPKVLSDVRKLSRDPESILEGIGPEDHIWECFYEIECVWWAAHLDRDATFDSEGKVVTPEASQLRTDVQLHALAVAHPNTVLHKRRYLAKHGKLTFKEMMAEMERDGLIPVPPKPEETDRQMSPLGTPEMQPSTTQGVQFERAARYQSSGTINREPAPEPAVDRNLQLQPARGYPSTSAYPPVERPSRNQFSTGSVGRAQYPYPQPSGGQVNRPRNQAAAHQTQRPSLTPEFSVVPNMQLPEAFAEKEIKRRGRPRKIVPPALVSNSPQSNNTQVKTTPRYMEIRGGPYDRWNSLTAEQKRNHPQVVRQRQLADSARRRATPQSSEPPRRLPALAPALAPRRQNSWEHPIGSETTRSHIQNHQSPGMTGHSRQFHQADQAAKMPYQPVRRTMPPANPQTPSFPYDLRFMSQTAPAQPQPSPRTNRERKIRAEKKIWENHRQTLEGDGALKTVSQSTSQSNITKTDNKASNSTKPKRVRSPDPILQLVGGNYLAEDGVTVLNYTGLPGHRRPWEHSSDDDLSSYEESD